MKLSFSGIEFKLRKNDKAITVDADGIVKIHTTRPKYDEELQLWYSSNSKILGVITPLSIDWERIGMNANQVSMNNTYEDYASHMVFTLKDLYIGEERISEPKEDILDDLAANVERIIHMTENGAYDDITYIA